MTKYLRNENTEAEPVSGIMRQKKPAAIPPFSFVGELEVGLSGFWYPTANMYLKTASVTCSGDGITNGVLTLLVEQPYSDPQSLTVNPFTLEADPFILATDARKVVKSLNNAYVTPYDKIYVASWADSAHTGVVVQIVGDLVT